MPFALLSTEGVQHAIVRIVPAAAVLVGLWTIESAYHGIASGKWRHGFRNLSLAAVNGAVLFFTVGLATIASAEYAESVGFGMLHWTGWPEWLGLVAAFLALDLYSYAWHRANHRSEILWRFHRVHHSDHAMDVTTSARFHVGELAIAGSFRLPLVWLVGISSWSLLLYEAILVAVSMFHHSSLRLGRADRWLRLLIVTPEMHSVHHSRDADDCRTNFASVLPIWDRLFQTHRAAEPRAPHGLAGCDDEARQSVTSLLAMPFMTLDRAESDDTREVEHPGDWFHATQARRTP